jgi:hypothetical protein
LFVKSFFLALAKFKNYFSLKIALKSNETFSWSNFCQNFAAKYEGLSSVDILQP